MKFLKFLGAKRFGLRTTTGFLNLTPASHNGFRILKFTRVSARLVDTAQNFILRNGFKILKLVCEPLRALRRVLPNADKAETGRAEKFSKFSLTSAFLNFISLPPRKFKFELLKFMREVPRNRFEILKFTLAPRKFKPAPAVRLNFALNSVLPARAAKFERSAR